jgi:hypothetical protein
VGTASVRNLNTRQPTTLWNTIVPRATTIDFLVCRYSLTIQSAQLTMILNDIYAAERGLLTL